MTDLTPAAKIDRRERSLRTLAQGAVVTAVVALATVLAAGVAGRPLDEVDWSALAGMAGGAVLTAVASYVAANLAPPKTQGPGEGEGW